MIPTASAATIHAGQRYHDLDALRAFVMFLGILLHATLFIQPEYQMGWPIYDPAAMGDKTYAAVFSAIHGFRMPLFFLLSGFFSALIWKKKGLRALRAQRMKQVGLPFAVGCIILAPLTVGLLFLAAKFLNLHMVFMPQHEDPFDFNPILVPLVWLAELTYLWFLWYLLLLVAGFIFLARLGIQFSHRIWWITLPVSAGLALTMFQPHFGPVHNRTLLPHIPLLLFYFCFFSFGAFLYKAEIRPQIRWTAALLPTAACLWIGMLTPGWIEVIPSSPFNYPFAFPLNWFEFASSLAGVTYAWLMCFGLMGLFHWVASRPSFTVRYFSDAAYWTYLIHLPIIICMQLLIVDWPVSYHLKFMLICVGTTAVSLATYQVFVRYTFIGSTLNGRRTRQSDRCDYRMLAS